MSAHCCGHRQMPALTFVDKFAPSGFAQRVKRSLTELVEGTTSKPAKTRGKVLEKVEFYEFNPAVDASVNAMEKRMIKAEGGISPESNLLNQRNAPSTAGKN